MHARNRTRPAMCKTISYPLFYYYDLATLAGTLPYIFLRLFLSQSRVLIFSLISVVAQCVWKQLAFLLSQSNSSLAARIYMETKLNLISRARERSKGRAHAIHARGLISSRGTEPRVVPNCLWVWFLHRTTPKR